jgi:putative nucleotidyltransferase with HDIG domain
MEEEHKAKEQLINELAELRQRAAELEALETQRKRAEEALRESERFLQSVFDSIQDGISVLDRDLKVIGTNSWIEKMYAAQMPLVGKKCHVVYQGLQSPCPWCPSIPAIETGRMHTETVPYPSVEKPTGWLELSAFPLQDDEGHVVGVIEHAKDVTERKRAEEKIRQHAAQLEALRQMGLELTAQLNLDALLCSVVSRAVELLGGTSGGIAFYRPDRDVMEWTVTVGLDSLPPEPFVHRGEGLAGKILETGEPLIIDDYQHWEGRVAGWEGYPFRAVVGVPVRWGDEFLGVLDVERGAPCAFSPADAELLSLFAAQAAIAIQNARLYEEIHSRAERLAVVNHIARAAGTILDLDDLLETVYREITSVFQADAFFIALYDEGSNELDFRVRVDEGIRESRERRPLGTGLTAIVVSKNKSLLIRDFEKERDQLPEASLWGTMRAPPSWLGVPMLIGQQLIGVICVQAYHPHAYGEEEELLLSTIADQVAVAIEQARLYEAEREQRELAEALEEAAAAVSSTLEPDQVLDRILEQVERVVAGDAFNVMLVEDGTARVVRWRGYERLGIEERIARFSTPVVELPSLVHMIQTREPVVIPDTSTDPEWILLEGWEWLHSYVGALIQVGGVTVGTLSVDGTRPGQFGPADAHRLRAFADAAATAIKNARLFEQAQQEITERKRAEVELQQSVEQLRRTFEGMVEVLVSTIGIRDPYTASHQRRVTQLACAIADEMGLPKEQIQGLRMAGLVHDLGKINVPAEILSKPGILSDLEHGMIRMHPQVGYDVLKKFDFPWPVAQIVLQHHERLDGSGYPQGLLREGILLEARILAVADVVAAMSSHRPYRAALGIDKALEEISHNRGVLYDAEVVSTCLRLFAEKGFEFE